MGWGHTLNPIRQNCENIAIHSIRVGGGGPDPGNFWSAAPLHSESTLWFLSLAKRPYADHFGNFFPLPT